MIYGKKTSLTIKTINGEFTSNSTALESLEVASISEDNIDWLSLPRTFAWPHLPVDTDDITKLQRHWNLLKFSKVEMVNPKHLKRDFKQKQKEQSIMQPDISKAS